MDNAQRPYRAIDDELPDIDDFTDGHGHPISEIWRPSQEEIAARAAEVRENWSPAMRAKRRYGRPIPECEEIVDLVTGEPAFMPPQFSIAELGITDLKLGNF